MVPWSHLRQPSSGWVMTVLNSEFTHFNLVIRLSKVQQSALLLSTVFGDSRCSGCPLWTLWNAVLWVWCGSEHSETPFLPLQQLLQHHRIMSQHLNQAGTRLAGVVFFSFWFSGEVKLIVHLIHWNLEAVYAFYGWPEHGPGLAQRTTSRFRNWILV